MVAFCITAADGPGDRFIIGESQAGDQVSFQVYLYITKSLALFLSIYLCVCYLGPTAHGSAKSFPPPYSPLSRDRLYKVSFRFMLHFTSY